MIPPMQEAFAEQDGLHIRTARRARSAPIENPRSKDHARGGRRIRIAAGQSLPTNFFILDEFLINPVPAVTASPNPSVYEPTGNRSPRNDDRPKMPNFRPSGSRRQCSINEIMTANHHLPSRKTKAAQGMVAQRLRGGMPGRGVMSGAVVIAFAHDAATKLVR